MSHHLSHAYSAASQSPFDSGMILIMDGMGDTYRSMRRASDSNDPTFVTDLDSYPGEGRPSYDVVPSDIRERSERSVYDWREGESIYVFEKENVLLQPEEEEGGTLKTAKKTTSNSSGRISIRPVFKRFVEERTPPHLYNHGFHDMDSAGAIYSRASTHILGDWNSCGKVMGLAPWMGYVWEIDEDDEDLQS